MEWIIRLTLGCGLRDARWPGRSGWMDKWPCLSFPFAGSPWISSIPYARAESVRPPRPRKPGSKGAS